MRTGCLKYLAVIICLAVFAQSSAQIVVAAETPLATSNATQIVILDNLIVNSAAADFSKATLTLKGATQTLTNGSSAAVLLGGLIVGEEGSTNNGTKTITGGAWEVAGTLVFNDGMIVPQTGGKIVHTAPEGNPGDIQMNNPDSYVNGVFYSKGSGTRFFPIGDNGYFPAQLFNVTQSDIEIGMRVKNSSPSLSHGNDILDVFQERYWELIDPSGSFAGSLLAISMNQTSAFIEPTVGTVLVGSGGIATGANSLGGAIDGDYIVGATGISVNDRIFTLAKINSDKVVVKIHNVITPFLDNANDYLQIENIDVFPDNKVTLLDRWGGKVKEWKNYSNVAGSPSSSHDLSKVSTGNYICIVEYKDGDTIIELSQMVTIINH